MMTWLSSQAAELEANLSEVARKTNQYIYSEFHLQLCKINWNRDHPLLTNFCNLNRIMHDAWKNREYLCETWSQSISSRGFYGSD